MNENIALNVLTVENACDELKTLITFIDNCKPIVEKNYNRMRNSIKNLGIADCRGRYINDLDTLRDKLVKARKTLQQIAGITEDYSYDTDSHGVVKNIFDGDLAVPPGLGLTGLPATLQNHPSLQLNTPHMDMLKKNILDKTIKDGAIKKDDDGNKNPSGGGKNPSGGDKNPSGGGTPGGDSSDNNDNTKDDSKIDDAADKGAEEGKKAIDNITGGEVEIPSGNPEPTPQPAPQPVPQPQPTSSYTYTGGGEETPATPVVEETPVEDPVIIEEPDIEAGNKYSKIPTSTISKVASTTKSSGGNSVIPVLAGISAAAAAGIGAKAYMDRKKNKDNDGSDIEVTEWSGDEGYTDSDDGNTPVESYSATSKDNTVFEDTRDDESLDEYDTFEAQPEEKYGARNSADMEDMQ